MPLNVRVEPGRTLAQMVHLEGRLDTETVEILDKELETLLAQDVKVLVFDLAALDYISSAGLRSLFGAQKTMGQRGGEALLLNPQPQVQKVFDIVKAVPLKTIFRSVAELDSYLDTIQRKALEE
jgi:anti-anti-sigma factor